jgi:hypothetical protein
MASPGAELAGQAQGRVDRDEGHRTPPVRAAVESLGCRNLDIQTRRVTQSRQIRDGSQDTAAACW